MIALFFQKIGIYLISLFPKIDYQPLKVCILDP